MLIYKFMNLHDVLSNAVFMNNNSRLKAYYHKAYYHKV